MLATRNVYLDTQTFIRNNYFNSKILEMVEFAEQNHIRLCFTSVTIDEIRSNLQQEIHAITAEINKFNTLINNKGKVIKNLPVHEQYTKLPGLSPEESCQTLMDRFDRLLKRAEPTMIGLEHVELGTVFRKYFNKEKPFGREKKKSEFPDAIVISAIEGWCAKEQEKIYFVSEDKDLQAQRLPIFLLNNPYRTFLIRLINRFMKINMN